jgi:aspartate oxidase
MSGKYMVSGDGGAKGRSLTDIDIKGRRGVSVEDGRRMARIVKANGMGGIEIMPKALNKQNDNLVNVDFMQYDVLAAITKASRA